MASRYRVLASGIDGPEGVAWDGAEFLYTGSQDGLLHQVSVETGVRRVVADLEGRILGITLGRDGSIVVCNQDQQCVQRVFVDSGLSELVSRGTADAPMLTPNFVSADRDGGFYVSDSGNWGDPDGRIYHWSTDGSTTLSVAGDLHFANGMAFDSEGRWLYLIESATGAVSRYNTRFGISDPRAGELVWSAPAGSIPDGLSLCSDGGILVSFYEPNMIMRFLDGVATIVVDDSTGALRSPTNSAFFGPTLDRLCVANLGGDDLVEIVGTGLSGGTPFRVAFDEAVHVA